MPIIFFSLAGEGRPLHWPLRLVSPSLYRRVGAWRTAAVVIRVLVVALHIGCEEGTARQPLVQSSMRRHQADTSCLGVDLGYSNIKSDEVHVHHSI